MEKIENKIIDNFNKIEQNIYGEFASLWQSEAHFEKHIEKRISLEHITDKNDYIAKTIQCLSTADEYIFAQHEKSWDNICYNGNKSWAVIFNDNGKIITSYKMEPEVRSFEEIHAEVKAKIRKGAPSEKFREYFRRLQSRYRILDG